MRVSTCLIHIYVLILYMYEVSMNKSKSKWYILTFVRGPNDKKPFCFIQNTFKRGKVKW
jgi:hypothetical protein